jgi:GNAT superfamily N-acetyltransferase
MIRPAIVEDLPVVLELIRELATYEREPDAVVATEEHLRVALFGPEPAVFCLVAEESGDAERSAEVVGFAIWFRTFSTWLGTHGIHLEDLFVRPTARRGGHGRALLAALAAIAVERGYGRLEWSVLDWNAPAQDFYTSLGAEPMQEWTTWRLAGAALPALGRTHSHL